MTKKFNLEIQWFLFLSTILIIANVQSVEGIVTGSENFCAQFPTFPECTGWRVEPINDRYWFCEYVDLPTMCKFKPDPKKEITTLQPNECCNYFPSGETIDMTAFYIDSEYDANIRIGRSLPADYSVNELVIWTDKDHYRFGERVNVYGKFDFGDEIIKNGNKVVDIKFNNHVVIPGLPVDQNGWFSGLFYITDSRFYYNGISSVTVSYFHQATVDQPGKYAQATYQFLTGDINPPKKPLKIDIEHDSRQEDISYRVVDVELKETQLDFFIMRITNPDNISFTLPRLSMENLDAYIDKITDLIPGKYTITLTVGNFTSKQEFHVGNTYSIPKWIKNNAGWWADGQIDDDSFVQGIQYLIREGIIVIPPTTQSSVTYANNIPSWIKNNAGWWADGQIDDDSFVQGIQYLIREGIIDIR